jgi:hypothetical protein
MADTYFGRDSYIMFDKVLAGDGAYGTATSDWITAHPLIGTTLSRTVEKTPRPHLLTGNANRRSHFVSNDNAGGTFTIEANYNTIGLILKHALGAAATAAGSPASHTYTQAADLPDNGLTATVVRGSGGTGETFEGVRLSSLTLSANSSEVMQLSGEIIAETSNAVTTDGAEGRASAETVIAGIVDAPVLHHHAGSLSWDGLTLNVRSMSVTINNALARRQFLGSKLTKEPLRSDFSSVEVTLEIDADDSVYGKYIGDVQEDATMTFDNGGAGSAEREMAFTFSNAYLSECTDPVNSAGLVSMSLKFICESDGTDHGLKIVMKNEAADGEVMSA